MHILQMPMQALSTSALVGLNVDANGNFMGKGAFQEERNYAIRRWTVFVSLPGRIPEQHVTSRRRRGIE